MADMELVRVIALDEEAFGPEAGQYLLVDSASGTKKMQVDRLLQAAELSDAVKSALLTCFQKVAWIDEYGQNYYEALESALYPDEYPKITAVFNPGTHIVCTDDTTNDLKQYLTVTYFETEESAGTIVPSADYAIFGDLNAGNVLLTVLYDTLRTSFSVYVKDCATDYYTINSMAYSLIDTDKFYLNSTQNVNRAASVSEHGSNKLRYDNAGGADSDYYPIPIPVGASKFWVKNSIENKLAYNPFILQWDPESNRWIRIGDSVFVYSNEEVTLTDQTDLSTLTPSVYDVSSYNDGTYFIAVSYSSTKGAHYSSLWQKVVATNYNAVIGDAVYNLEPRFKFN